MAKVLAVVLVVSAVYFPAYWNHIGRARTAPPARSSRPSHRTRATSRRTSTASRRTRTSRLNIRQGGAIGRGFGVPIDYMPGTITDISSIDPLILYVPHNGVLYILMRMGLFGGIAFWSLLGAGILTGCRLVRSRNREVAVFGARARLRARGLRTRGLQRPGLLHVPHRLRDRGAARARRGGAPARRSRPRRGTGDGCCPSGAAADGASGGSTGSQAEAPAGPGSGSRASTLLAAPLRPHRAAPALVLLPIAIGFFIWLVFAGAGKGHERSVPGHADPHRPTSRLAEMIRGERGCSRTDADVGGRRREAWPCDPSAQGSPDPSDQLPHELLHREHPELEAATRLVPARPGNRARAARRSPSRVLLVVLRARARSGEPGSRSAPTRGSTATA